MSKETLMTSMTSLFARNADLVRTAGLPDCRAAGLPGCRSFPRSHPV